MRWSGGGSEVRINGGLLGNAGDQRPSRRGYTPYYNVGFLEVRTWRKVGTSNGCQTRWRRRRVIFWHTGAQARPEDFCPLAILIGASIIWSVTPPLLESPLHPANQPDPTSHLYFKNSPLMSVDKCSTLAPDRQRASLLSFAHIVISNVWINVFDSTDGAVLQYLLWFLPLRNIQRHLSQTFCVWMRSGLRFNSDLYETKQSSISYPSSYYYNELKGVAHWFVSLVLHICSLGRRMIVNAGSQWWDWDGDTLKVNSNGLLFRKDDIAVTKATRLITLRLLEAPCRVPLGLLLFLRNKWFSGSPFLIAGCCFRRRTRSRHVIHQCCQKRHICIPPC